MLFVLPAAPPTHNESGLAMIREDLNVHGFFREFLE